MFLFSFALISYHKLTDTAHMYIYMKIYSYTWNWARMHDSFFVIIQLSNIIMIKFLMRHLPNWSHIKPQHNWRMQQKQNRTTDGCLWILLYMYTTIHYSGFFVVLIIVAERNASKPWVHMKFLAQIAQHWSSRLDQSIFMYAANSSATQNIHTYIHATKGNTYLQIYIYKNRYIDSIAMLVNTVTTYLFFYGPKS